MKRHAAEVLHLACAVGAGFQFVGLGVQHGCAVHRRQQREMQDGERDETQRGPALLVSGCKMTR